MIPFAGGTDGRVLQLYFHVMSRICALKLHRHHVAGCVTSVDVINDVTEVGVVWK